MGFVAILTIVWSLTIETYAFVQTNQATFGENWWLAAQMAVSIVWTFSGVVLFLLGTGFRMRMLRLLGLGLLGVTSNKVFIFDVSQLDAIYRILSCGALGLSLIGISWLYSRFEIAAVKKPPVSESETANEAV